MSKTALPMTMYGEGGEQLLPRTRTEMVYDGEHTLSEYITKGVLNVAHGGTGLSSIAKDKMLYASAANTLAEVTTSQFGRSLLNATSGVKFTNLYADKSDWAAHASSSDTATTAGKVENSLSVNGKTYNGSSAVDVGTIGVGYGGTGMASLTANRLIYASATNAFSLGHYVTSTQMTIGASSAPDSGFGLKVVNGIQSTGNIVANGGIAAMGIYETSDTPDALSSLVDVQISSPQNGQFLGYGNGKWSNMTLPTASTYTLGCIKTGASNSGRDFALKVDGSGNGYVSVPSDIPSYNARVRCFEYAANAISSGTVTVNHGLNNSTPMVYAMYSGTATANYYYMCSGTSASAMFSVEVTDANNVTVELGTNYISKKVRIFVIG